MPSPRNRKPAKISADAIKDIRRTASRLNYEDRRGLANMSDNEASKPRFSVGNYRGQFKSRADMNRQATIARQIRKDASLRGNDYQYGTREQVAAQHNSRYRNIRRAFGMSAG